jgi:hypothetical protein
MAQRVGSSTRPVRHSNRAVRPDELTPDANAWVAQNEARWRRAHAIAAKYPGLDAGDVYHVLYTLHETPTQRLRRSLAHGRLRTRAG